MQNCGAGSPAGQEERRDGPLRPAPLLLAPPPRPAPRLLGCAGAQVPECGAPPPPLAPLRALFELGVRRGGQVESRRTEGRRWKGSQPVRSAWKRPKGSPGTGSEVPLDVRRFWRVQLLHTDAGQGGAEAAGRAAKRGEGIGFLGNVVRLLRSWTSPPPPAF